MMEEQCAVRDRIRVLSVKDNTIINSFYESIRRDSISRFNDEIMRRHNTLHWFNRALEETYGHDRYRGEGNPIDGIVIFNPAGGIVFKSTYNDYIQYRDGE